MSLEFLLFLLFVTLGSLPPPQAPEGIASPPTPPPSSLLPPQAHSFAVTYVFVIVVDGLRPDALRRAQTPNIDRLWQSGLYSWTAQTVMPSTTLPAIASLLSGVSPERHQILWNYWAPERGRITVPTIFEIAQREHISTVAFVSKRKLEQLFSPQTPLFVLNTDARGLIEEAIEYIVKHRPRLVFLHLSDVDDAGHRSGWMTVKQFQAIERVDEAIGLLLASLEESHILESSVIIVTADHGGHGRIHGTDDPRDTTIPWILWTPKIEIGRELNRAIRIYDTAATVLAALGIAIPSDWLGVPVWEAFPEAILPR
ncbi:MAG: alkaline phosphatase family protein [Candidatus Bipolaricaulota bacterium]|nr:alkaline phosphatase family protein [Candidatus Bipolaricaulota bacterium]MDW8031190.1 alkaline phosphatase family protein [Candidatus Bipolaricaulota bacterium]